MIKLKLNGVKGELLRVSKAVDSPAEFSKRVSAMRTSLVAATPIDTGFARSEWEVRKVNDKTFVVENSADYIVHLNNGSSKQAPAHFVEAVALSYGFPIGEVATTTKE